MDLVVCVAGDAGAFPGRVCRIGRIHLVAPPLDCNAVPGARRLAVVHPSVPARSGLALARIDVGRGRNVTQMQGNACTPSRPSFGHPHGSHRLGSRCRAKDIVGTVTPAILPLTGTRSRDPVGRTIAEDGKESPGRVFNAPTAPCVAAGLRQTCDPARRTDIAAVSTNPREVSPRT